MGISMNKGIPRRVLVPGAAWAVPTITLVTAVPAFAISAQTIHDCGDFLQLVQLQAGSTKPTLTAYGYTAINGYKSTMTVSMGIWNIPGARRYQTTAGVPITGFYALPGRCGVTNCASHTVPLPNTPNVVTTADGKQYDAQVSLYTPYRCSPQTAGAGLSQDFTIRTMAPYSINAGGIDPNKAPESTPYIISLPYSLIPVNGLEPVSLVAGEPPAGCCVYFNAKFDTSDGNGLPRTALEYNWSLTPMAKPAVMPPVIKTAKPALAKAGQTVRLTGVFLANTSSVTVNGKSATFTQIDDNTVDIIIPVDSGARWVYYPIVLTTPGGTTDYRDWQHGGN